MIAIRGMRGMGAMGDLSRTITVDPIVVNGQTAGPGSVIDGDKPPLIPSSWWPWLIAAGALGLAYWVSTDADAADDDDQEEGDADDGRPFDE